LVALAFSGAESTASGNGGVGALVPGGGAVLDRVAFAVDGAESSHGADLRMWRSEPDGPQGPMQVSAAAAADAGGGDRFDDKENRTLGRAYLARMYRRYGSWPDAVAAYNPHRPRPKNVSGLLKNLRYRADGRLHWHWDPAFIRRADPVEPPQFTDVLLQAARRIRTPTLLVRGMKSDVVSPSAIAEFQQCLPSLEVVDVAGAGHMVAGDKNDVFNHGVIEFLTRHLPAK